MRLSKTQKNISKTKTTGRGNTFMRHAIRLAQKASIHDTLPNPRVGAIVVKNGMILATGYHKTRTSVHAEVDALSKLSHKEAKNAELYCTLEPCCTTWKGKLHPPCTDAILQYGISAVYLACTDPNPRIKEKGITLLEKHGVRVVMLPAHIHEARLLNEAFYALHHTARGNNGRPFVHVKTAQSLDARLAAIDGSSQWITNPAARAYAHTLRAQSHMICTGIGTILADNPRYDIRLHKKYTAPALAIVDSTLHTPPDAQCLSVERRAPGTVVFTTLRGYAKHRIRTALERRGVAVLCIPEKSEALHKNMGRRRAGVSLTAMLNKIVSMEVYTLMVEAGAMLTNAFIQHNLVDKINCFIAPLLLGGATKNNAVQSKKYTDPYSFGKTLHSPTIADAQVLHYARIIPLPGEHQTYGTPQSPELSSARDNCLISGYTYDIFAS